MPEPTFTIDVENRLGEGPVWDDRAERLWWTDILASRLYHWDWGSRAAGYVELPERLGCLGLTSNPEILICAFASGFALFNTAANHVEWLARPELDYRGIRFNDGRVDRHGRFWAGTMIEDESLAGESAASVFRLDPDGKVTRLFGGVGVSNGICFSPGGEKMYFSDSPLFGMWSFELDANGTPSNRQPIHFVRTGGHPDGAEIDAQGNIWSAEWGSSLITQYSSDGEIISSLNSPVRYPTCPAFGGPHMDHLFVTSARESMSEQELAEENDAGKVLVYRVGAKGIPAPRFDLSVLRP